MSIEPRSISENGTPLTAKLRAQKPGESTSAALVSVPRHAPAAGGGGGSVMVGSVVMGSVVVGSEVVGSAVGTEVMGGCAAAMCTRTARAIATRGCESEEGMV